MKFSLNEQELGFVVGFVCGKVANSFNLNEKKFLNLIKEKADCWINEGLLHIDNEEKFISDATKEIEKLIGEINEEE